MANKNNKNKQDKAKRVPVTNHMLLKYPTDKWGFTRDLRKAAAKTASRLSGDKDKKRLLDETMEIILTYFDDKYKADSASRKTLLDNIAKRDEAARKANGDTVALERGRGAPVQTETGVETKSTSNDTPEANKASEPTLGEDLENAMFGDEKDM